MRFLWIVLLLVCSPVAAQQSAFDNSAHVQRNVFRHKLYACGGTTLYCGLPFAAGEKSVDGRDLTIEHAYPADWIATHHRCENRKSCKVEAYGRVVADLHNLWPAIANINSSRQDQSLGETPGEQQRPPATAPTKSPSIKAALQPCIVDHVKPMPVVTQ